MSETAQSLVELALLLPLMLFMLAGMVDVASLASDMIYVGHIATEINRALLSKKTVENAIDLGLAGELDLHQYEWDIWMMLARVDSTGLDWEPTPAVEHVYGFFMVMPNPPAWPVTGFLDGNSAGVAITGVTVGRERRPLLLGPLWDAVGVTWIAGRNVQRNVLFEN